MTNNETNIFLLFIELSEKVPSKTADINTLRTSFAKRCLVDVRLIVRNVGNWSV